MNDQQPVYDPPPYQAPVPTTDSGAAGIAPPPPAPAVPQKKKPTALIIAIVVGSLLLCCCIGGGAAALFFLPSDTVTSDSGSEAEELGDLPVAEDDPRLAEWLEWEPESPPMMPSAPSDKEPLIIDGLAVAAPGFAFEEAVWYAGEYDPAEDWYYADGYYIKASHPASTKISAAVELWIQSDAMLSEDVAFETAEGDILSSVGDRQLVYRPQWGDGFSLEGEGETDLWKLLGSQWPDGVVVDGSGDADSGIEVTITKWYAYAVDGDYPIVLARYVYEDGEWVLEEWEYQYPEADATPAT